MSSVSIFHSIGGFLFLSISILMAFFFSKSRPIVDVIFLVASVNYVIMGLLFFLGVSFSYLESPEDVNYYFSIAVLDLIYFSIVFGIFALFLSQHQITGALRYFANNWVLLVGSGLVIANLLYVAEYFGQPYAIISMRHTPLSEIGWILLSLFLLSYYPRKVSKKTFFWIVFLVLISLPFGARMQPSFAILALIAMVSHLKGKWIAAIFYIIITFLSILIGLFRDLNPDLNGTASLLTGINQGASYRTSAVLLNYYETLSFGQILQNTLSTFILYPLTGTFFTGESVYVNFSLENFRGIQGNGGNIGTLLYFYFGPFFPIVTFLFFLTLCKFKPLNWVVPFLVITSFRWQQYNLIPLIKIIPLIFLLLLVIQIAPKQDRQLT